ncbi:hypothetical protein DY000_02014460 [Brassica cretica]|uniref:Retrotransposon gag domain-containing protein n=1 Tax=Brassica cretica TaxID=69181 RepID=A0ABQ7D4R3_BRACR|nr:hypothetical protein DY000_02014460 [Brassica cretica]
MGQQAKWPQKMKPPDSFRNYGFWCEFHRDHSHKTEDCIALKIEVNELLRKGHLREFLSDKAKSHLSKETTGKPTEAAPVSPPRHDRVIHVISGGTDEVSFTAKEQEKVLTPHHDALVISLTVANCLVKRILVDNGSSSNIIFQAAYKDLGLEEGALTRRCETCGISEDAQILAKRQIFGSRIKVFDTMPRDVRDQCAGFRARLRFTPGFRGCDD